MKRGLLRPTQSSWMCFRKPPKSSPSIGTTSLASLSRPSSTSSSLAAQILGLNGRNYHFSVICITRSSDPGNSYRLINVAAADFTNLVGPVEQGYIAIPVVEDMLASHLSTSLASSWKSCPLLPTKLYKTTSTIFLWQRETVVYDPFWTCIV